MIKAARCSGSGPFLSGSELQLVSHYPRDPGMRRPDRRGTAFGDEELGGRMRQDALGLTVFDQVTAARTQLVRQV
jgi:hypothetical protein